MRWLNARVKPYYNYGWSEELSGNSETEND